MAAVLLRALHSRCARCRRGSCCQQIGGNDFKRKGAIGGKEAGQCNHLATRAEDGVCETAQADVDGGMGLPQVLAGVNTRRA